MPRPVDSPRVESARGRPIRLNRRSSALQETRLRQADTTLAALQLAADEAGRHPARPGSISGENCEWTSLERLDHAEVSFVQRGDGFGLVSVSEDDEGGVGEDEKQVSIPLRDCPSPDEVDTVERRQLLRSRRLLRQHRQFGIITSDARCEAIEFGEHEGRDHQRPGCSLGDCAPVPQRGGSSSGGPVAATLTGSPTDSTAPWGSTVQAMPNMALPSSIPRMPGENPSAE